ncbi:hypothetical protein HY2_01460 [Hyphomonas pacifica]|nr:hypothetical protein HY2_01460 [Hyphomonas pacifica]
MLVTAANETAVSILRGPESWPFPVVCVTAPARAGLTALGRAWCQKFEGRFYSAQEFSRMREKELSTLAGTYVVIDDADQVKKMDRLLTLINMISANAGRVLLTSRRSPGQWQTSSADLKSRLNALPVIEIDDPDEPMLKVRLEMAARKHFLKLDPEVVKYLVPRLDLSYEAIETFAEKLSERITLTGRAPSVPLAREVLEELGWSDPDQRPLL